MKKLFLLLTALMAIAAPKAVQALDIEGVYAGGLGGLNFAQYDHHGNKIDFKAGWTAGAFAGYRFCSGLRVEGELVYRDNKVDKVKARGHSKHSVKGHLHTWSAMVNGLYDFDVDCWCITPYLGAGIGYDWTKAKACNVSGKKDGFAWQLIAGGLYPIDDCMEMGLEYRFHNATKDSNIYNNAIDLRVQWYF